MKETDRSSLKMNIYKKCTQYIKTEAVAALFFVGFTIFLDLYPCHNIWDQEKLSLYKDGNEVAIAVVIWTFMVSLFVYFMGKHNDRYYGIRLYDSLKMDFEEVHCSILWPAAIVFGELFFLITASICKLKITLIYIVFLQFLTMIYIFLAIFMLTTEESVMKLIQKKVLEGEYDMLKEMICYISFANEQERERLHGILTGQIMVRINQRLLYIAGQDKSRKQKKKELKRYERKEREEICSITQCILNKPDDCGFVWEILRQWFMEIDQNKLFSSKEIFILQQGIMKAVLENLTYENYKECERLMMCMNAKRYKKLVLWIFVYNIYLQDKEGEEWRKVCSKDLYQKMSHLQYNCKQKEERILKYWKEWNHNKNLDQIFPYIFD